MQYVLSLVCFILLAGGSALGQKTITPKEGPPPTESWISVEDTASGNFLVFSPLTGAYKFIRCRDGVAMSGLGIVKIDGCAIYLEDVQEDHRVLASVNICAQEGKAAVEIFSPAKLGIQGEAVKEYLSDENMRDNTLSCTKKQ